MLSKGRILFRGSPFDMLKAAEGHVWTFTTSGLEKPNHNLTVVSMLHLAEGMQYRLVGASAEEYPSAKLTPPGLEDAYVWLMKQASQEELYKYP